jgi:hypothetical protein
MAHGSAYWLQGPRYWPAAPGYGHLRASDADRDRAIEALKSGFAEGRLSKDEFAERQEKALMARTYRDLAALLADLPAGPSAVFGQPGVPGQAGVPSGFPGQPGLFRPTGPVGRYGPAGLPGPTGLLWPKPAPVSGFRAGQRINPLAAASLISAFVPFFGSVAAIVLGHAALREIRETGEAGSGMATAGIALGYLVVVVFIVTAMAAVVLSAHSPGAYPPGPPG